MANSTLAAIRTKIRRITRSPSISQISDSDLDEYINTAILYDFPEQLRLFSLRTLLTFYTQPGVDTYDTNTVDPNDPLYNFKNKYIAVHPPLFMAGIQAFYTQNRDVFYGYWPQFNTIADTLLRGNGTPGPFTGTVQAHPCLQNNVMFNCLDAAGTSMILVDFPTNNVTGVLSTSNAGPILGNINYLTGVFTITFPNNTQLAAPIYSTVIAYQPGKPLSMLYYDDKFTIRPVPDKSYIIQLEVDVRPTELINAGDVPYLEQWWQYISYLASKKIFEDRLDTDSIQLIMPSLMEQQDFVLRTTLTQQANERTVTIYTQGKQFGFGWFGGGWPY